MDSDKNVQAVFEKKIAAVITFISNYNSQMNQKYSATYILTEKNVSHWNHVSEYSRISALSTFTSRKELFKDVILQLLQRAGIVYEEITFKENTLIIYFSDDRYLGKKWSIASEYPDDIADGEGDILDSGYVYYLHLYGSVVTY